MTNHDLIKMLMAHPLDAQVFAFDPEVHDFKSITGCVSGPEPVRALGERFMENPPEPLYRIELQTEDID